MNPRGILPFAAVLALSSALAQPSPQAQRLYDEAQRLRTEATSTYPQGEDHIDQPLWDRAAAMAEQAVAAAPGAPSPLLLRAQIYSAVGFWAKAESAWNAYFAAVSDADPSNRAAMGTVELNLGYAAYQRGDAIAAQRRFELAAVYAPGEAQAFAWLGRLALERGDPKAALPDWEQAAMLTPNDPTALYFLAETRRAVQYGLNAARSYDQGILAYEGGRLTEALAAFRQATVDAPGLADAQRWLGRTALESGLGPEAVSAYQRAIALEGATASDAFFLDYARQVSAHGLAAVKAYRRAYDLYTAKDLAGATKGFEDATLLNPDFQVAWAWLGRVRLEAGDRPGAVRAYTVAVRLDPNDRSSAYFLSIASGGR